MSRRKVMLALAAIVLFGLGLRVLALFWEPPHHPDELFQYLEPAWGRLTGAAVETWEWRSSLRSWVLPGYHGAWLALLMRLGVRDGATLGTLLRAHWALLSLVMVWAGWRGGALLARRLLPAGAAPTEPLDEDRAAAPPSGWQGGLLAALLCAAFPLLVRFSIHTLSELASILCMVSALVLTGELAEPARRAGRGKALVAGVLLGLGICLRIQHAPVALVAVLWLLVARRFRSLALVAAGAALPAALFGLVDLLTWGKPFGSFIAYVRFNLLEGGATHFGSQPRLWYARLFSGRLPLGLPLLGILCVLGIRATWPFFSAALALALALSTQAHKEERFAMLFWPLMLIPAAATVGAWLAARAAQQPPAGSAPAPSRRRVWLARSVVAAVIALVLADGARHCRGNDFTGLTPRRYQAQAWAGRQPGVTGLLYDEPLYCGGYLWFGRPFPQLQFQPALLGNPLFSHVLVQRGSESMNQAQRAGFAQVFAAGDFVVLERRRSGR
jgi:GPI mannosyltransferase 3